MLVRGADGWLRRAAAGAAPTARRQSSGAAVAAAAAASRAVVAPPPLRCRYRRHAPRPPAATGDGSSGGDGSSSERRAAATDDRRDAADAAADAAAAKAAAAKAAAEAEAAADREAAEMADELLAPAWNKLKRELKKELGPDQAKLVDDMSLSDVLDGDKLMREVAEHQLGPVLRSTGSDEDPFAFFIGAAVAHFLGWRWGQGVVATGGCEGRQRRFSRRQRRRAMQTHSTQRAQIDRRHACTTPNAKPTHQAPRQTQTPPKHQPPDLVKIACALQLASAAALFYGCELGLHLDAGDSFRAVGGLALGYFARIFIPIEQLVRAGGVVCNGCVRCLFCAVEAALCALRCRMSCRRPALRPLSSALSLRHTKKTRAINTQIIPPHIYITPITIATTTATGLARL